MSLTLFDTDAPTVDHLAECKSRLNLLDIDRVFIEPSGANIKSRLIYTLPINCEHELFDRTAPNEFTCREKDCRGIITQNQIIGYLE